VVSGLNGGNYADGFVHNYFNAAYACQAYFSSMDSPAVFDPIAEARRQWVAHWGEAPAPHMSAVTSIMRVQQILMSRLNELLKPLDLTFPRYEALMLLYFSRSKALPLGKIGERLQVHPTSVTNTIDGLERLGYVSRERSPRDRRQTLAAITPIGHKTAESATAILNTANFATTPLRNQELETISKIFTRIRADADGRS
jgi:DNA-binding MarR family transcriptional regulator